MYKKSSILATFDLWYKKFIRFIMVLEVKIMNFSDKLKLVRKSKGLSQEQLAENLFVSRQAVAKWESGQVFPDISNLIQLSNIFHVTVDYLVKDAECSASCIEEPKTQIDELIKFRLEANNNTYAAYMNETDSTRFDSHDFEYSKGPYTYHDTYVGGEQFAGEETIYFEGKAKYAMNYIGRVLGQQFSGDFLKEALRMADDNMPYRGPEYFQSGEYVYKCNVVGDFGWFQGNEEIFCNNEKVYECYFHGGMIK